MVRITPEMREAWRSRTPAMERIDRLQRRLFQVRHRPKLERATEHCWNRLLDAIFQREREELPESHQGTEEAKYLRLGWVVLSDRTLNKDFNHDRFMVHPDKEPLISNPRFRAVLKRNRGVWEIPSSMLCALRNHPWLRQMASEDRHRLRCRTAKEEVLEMASRRNGQAEVGSELLDALDWRTAPAWLDYGVFWEILRNAVELGIEIGREEVLTSAGKVLQQGVRMDPHGKGKGSDLFSGRLETILQTMRDEGLARPTPTATLKRMGLHKPSRSDEALSCPLDPALSACLASDEITFSRFRERVEYWRQKIWGV